MVEGMNASQRLQNKVGSFEFLGGDNLEHAYDRALAHTRPRSYTAVFYLD